MILSIKFPQENRWNSSAGNYSQPLPGGAKLWMRRDEIRKEANFYNADSYAITLQDNTFFSKGWESEESIIERLTKYFELK